MVERDVMVGGMLKCCIKTLEDYKGPEIDGVGINCWQCDARIEMSGGAWRWVPVNEWQRRRARARIEREAKAKLDEAAEKDSGVRGLVQDPRGSGQEVGIRDAAEQPEQVTKP